MDSMTFFQTLISGVGATVVMDLWSLFQKYIIKIAPLNYALAGRWILWIPKGKFRHNTIISTAPVQGERVTGWLFHYLTGVLFAFIPLILDGSTWFHDPSFKTALLTGLLTLFAPFIVLQPALGFGFAASRTPRPWRARLLSLLTHIAYGCGLSITTLLTY